MAGVNALGQHGTSLWKLELAVGLCAGSLGRIVFQDKGGQVGGGSGVFWMAVLGGEENRTSK